MRPLMKFEFDTPVLHNKYRYLSTMLQVVFFINCLKNYRLKTAGSTFTSPYPFSLQPFCCSNFFIHSLLNKTNALLLLQQQQQQQQPFILTRLFFTVHWGQPRLWPSHNILLHLDLSQASSLQSSFFLISSLNTSLYLFLGLPFTPSPSTCSVSILFIQHNSSHLST